MIRDILTKQMPGMSFDVCISLLFFVLYNQIKTNIWDQSSRLSNLSVVDVQKNYLSSRIADIYKSKSNTRGPSPPIISPSISFSHQQTMAVDTGLAVVVLILTMYIMLVLGLLFYIKNDWCDLLFKNYTVN